MYVCVYMFATWVQVPSEAKEGIRSLELELQAVVNYLLLVSEPISGPLQEQYILLAAEPPLQHLAFWARALLYSPGSSRTPFVAKAGLKLTMSLDFSLPGSRITGIHLHTQLLEEILFCSICLFKIEFCCKPKLAWRLLYVCGLSLDSQ